MTTLTELLVQVRNVIGDSGTVISDAQLTQFINEAIKDISIHFPIPKTYTLSTALNDRKYDLEGDFISVVSVEFPTGDDPPTYLKRRSYLHASFWQVDGYYHVITRHPQGARD